MKVVDHRPHAWFLLASENRLLFDVNSGHSFVGYSILIELDDNERSQHFSLGRDYLDELAETIHNSAPGVRDSQSIYKDRNISSQYGSAVTSAVVAWRSESDAKIEPS